MTAERTRRPNRAFSAPALTAPQGRVLPWLTAPAARMGAGPDGVEAPRAAMRRQPK